MMLLRLFFSMYHCYCLPKAQVLKTWSLAWQCWSQKKINGGWMEDYQATGELIRKEVGGPQSLQILVFSFGHEVDGFAQHTLPPWRTIPSLKYHGNDGNCGNSKQVESAWSPAVRISEADRHSDHPTAFSREGNLAPVVRAWQLWF